MVVFESFQGRNISCNPKALYEEMKNNPKYKDDQATLKAFYEKARPNYEKAKELKPDQKDLWLNGLYRVYYNLQMGPEFDAIEKLMQ